VGEAELGHFDPSSNDYSWVKLSGSYEIVSLYGNIAVVDGKPFIHAHAARLTSKAFGAAPARPGRHTQQPHGQQRDQGT
jgi:predicted DNA-binding protein with PD1-like motif